jgi:hypothetical protein
MRKRCRGAEEVVQRSRGARVQRCRYGGDEGAEVLRC